MNRGKGLLKLVSCFFSRVHRRFSARHGGIELLGSIGDSPSGGFKIFHRRGNRGQLVFGKNGRVELLHNGVDVSHSGPEVADQCSSAFRHAGDAAAAFTALENITGFDESFFCPCSIKRNFDVFIAEEAGATDGKFAPDRYLDLIQNADIHIDASHVRKDNWLVRDAPYLGSRQQDLRPPQKPAGIGELHLDIVVARESLPEPPEINDHHSHGQETDQDE